MICKYETRIVAACPVDGRPDVYDVTLISGNMISCETIVSQTQICSSKKMYQEDITAELARALNCKVITVGYHSGVKTTVEAP